jgi:hypothetical protein
MKQRRRYTQQLSLQDRLSAWANEARQRADKLCPGPERDMLLKKVEQADNASRLNEWVSAPILQPSNERHASALGKASRRRGRMRADPGP